MNFFEAQATARRKSMLATILFVVAVVSIIVLLNFFILWFISAHHNIHVNYSLDKLFVMIKKEPGIPMLTTITTLLFVIFGSTTKYSMLANGGKVIAEMLEGRLIPSNSTDPMECKVLNVVEEMALASGISVPPVYVLEEAGINAFAAGWTPGSAIIGITRGAVMFLNRDELQGVIAHEFSHIFNGDMRLNIRLVVMIHGLESVTNIGRFALKFVRVAAIAGIIGLFFMIFGYLGVLFSDCIKAIVCRQREYLADASAVQFTRQTSGIVGALRKIGGLKSGSMIESPFASEFSHGYFSSYNYLSSSDDNGLFSTHPPIEERILRLDPAWDGKFTAPSIEMLRFKYKMDRERDKPIEGDIIYSSDAIDAVDKIGQTTEQHFKYARTLFKEVSYILREDSKDPYSARALVYCSLIVDHPYTNSKQWNELKNNADPHVYTRTKELYPLFKETPDRFRLPVFQLSMPALRALSVAQYKMFRRNVEALIQADRNVTFKEWVVQRFILQPLDEAFGLRRRKMSGNYDFNKVKPELALIISALTNKEYDNNSGALYAFQLVANELDVKDLKPVGRNDIRPTKLDQAVDKLELLSPKLKSRLLKALINSLTLDKKITVEGYELVRALASCLGCPMSPIVLAAS